MGDSPFFQLDKTTAENIIWRPGENTQVDRLVYVWVTIAKERSMLRLNLYDMSRI
jgi:hypothetical protein